MICALYGGAKRKPHYNNQASWKCPNCLQVEQLFHTQALNNMNNLNASPENTDQNLKCHSKGCKSEKRDTKLNMIVQGIYFDIISLESNPIYQTFLSIH